LDTLVLKAVLVYYMKVEISEELNKEIGMYLISNFRCVVDVVFLLLGDSPGF